MIDDPLKQTPACELDRDNRIIRERLRSRSLYLQGSSAERTMAEAADEIERQREELRVVLAHVEELRAEIERLTDAIRRIDGINDNPACYNSTINVVCDAILRPHLEPKP